jgi:hypothetical protein
MRSNTASDIMRECLKQLRPDAVFVVEGVDMVDVHALAIRAGGTVEEVETLAASGVLTRNGAGLFELWPSLQTVAAFRRPH